MHWFKQ